MSNATSGRLDKVLAHATIAGRPSGAVLRLERLALRIDQTAFAKAMGMSRQRLDIPLRESLRVTADWLRLIRQAKAPAAAAAVKSEDKS